MISSRSRSFSNNSDDECYISESGASAGVYGGWSLYQYGVAECNQSNSVSFIYLPVLVANFP